MQSKLLFIIPFFSAIMVSCSSAQNSDNANDKIMSESGMTDTLNSGAQERTLNSSPDTYPGSKMNAVSSEEIIKTFWLFGEMLYESEKNQYTPVDQTYKVKLAPDEEPITTNDGKFIFQRHDKGKYILEIYDTRNQIIRTDTVVLRQERLELKVILPKEIHEQKPDIDLKNITSDSDVKIELKSH